MILPKFEMTAGAMPSRAWPATVVVWGPGDATSPHAHHAIHLVLARRGTLRVSTEGEGSDVAGVYVPGNLTHAIDARGSDVVIVFVDPESEHGQGLVRLLGREIRSFGAERVESLLDGLSPTAEGVDAWLQGFFAELGVEPWRPRLHPGVAKVLAWLRGARPAADPRLEELAQLAGLSASRFSHAFKESVGLPPRTYLLWLRLLRAAGALQTTTSLTEAAHQAGFADAAHMSRTFRRMFGATPSEMLVRSRNVQADGGVAGED